jgi:AcrR family transcriptional regulator
MNKRSAHESKRIILAAARTVFTEQGYAQASMRDIARVAGISVGGLYLYFHNKEDLFQTFMQEWINHLNELTHEALVTHDDPVTAITSFISISIDFARSHKEMIILQGREWGFSLGIDLKKDYFAERRRIIAAIIKKGIETGDFVPCDADQAAKVIFTILRGFVVSMVIDEEALFLAEDCVNLILHGLLRRTNG